MMASGLWLAVLALLSSEAPSAGQARTRFMDSWKAGDGWEVKVEQKSKRERVAGVMHIVVLAGDTWQKMPCWRLSFQYVGKDASPDRCVMLLNKVSGWPEKIVLIQPKKLLDVPLREFQGARLLKELSEGFPVEVFAPSTRETMHKEKDGFAFAFKKTVEGEQILLDAGFKLKKKEIRVRQKWFLGEPWWREYERYVDG